MAQTRTSCPRCRQPVTAEVQQVFDLNQDPQAKEKLLSGQVNFIQCQSCGYEGNLATPIVYHDSEKELLLTFFPSEMGLPLNEQEKLLGPLITQVVNRLPLEKRKAYIFRPQSMLTYQTLIEKILEADGITKEMIQAQQARLNLLQRLLTTNESSLAEIIQQEDKQIDEAFFAIFNRIAEATMMNRDELAARQLTSLQQKLIEHSTFGKQIQEQAKETEAAVKSLQNASQKGLTRESLLQLIINAPNKTRLSALVGMTRSGMDYQFFQLLTDQIEKSTGDERNRLEQLRVDLLEMTRKIDEEIQARINRTKQLLEGLIKTPNLEEAVQQVLPGITNIFMDILQSEIDLARKNSDLDRLTKLNKIHGLIEQATKPTPEIEFVEKLLGTENDTEIRKLLEENQQIINSDFLDLLNNLIAQSEQENADPAIVNKLRSIDRLALRFSMQANLNK